MLGVNTALLGQARLALARSGFEESAHVGWKPAYNRRLGKMEMIPPHDTVGWTLKGLHNGTLQVCWSGDGYQLERLARVLEREFALVRWGRALLIQGVKDGVAER